MRDLVVTLAILGSLPLALYRPFIGIMVWTWLSLMNPHMLCWTWAAGQPFAQIVAVTVFASLLIHKQSPKQLPWVPISRVLLVFWIWMFVTTVLAFNPGGAWNQWDKVWKIQLFVFITMALLTTELRIKSLVWVMAISLGFYGVKGGIFTLTTGGGYHVMGPARTFIGGNNEIGLALIMTIPLLRFLQLSSSSNTIKKAMIVSIALTFVAILGTQSRGALLGLVAMSLYLIMKSRQKAVLIFFLIMLLPLAFLFMPESWHERMGTISDYEEDKSASGRINAWTMSWNTAMNHPLTGGGFNVFFSWAWRVYAPYPDDFHDVHSIYFEILGEHGFVGLALFLTLGILGLKIARSIVRQTKDDPRLSWMRDLASMIHVSLVGYAVSGAFLGLAYFDFYYTLLAVLAAMQALLAKYRAEGIPEPPAGPTAGLARSTPIGVRVKEWLDKI